MIQERCKCCGAVMPDQDTLKPLTLEDVIVFAERVTGVSRDLMLNGNKTHDIVRARHIVYYFGYYYTQARLKDVGAVGGSKHDAAIYGAKRTGLNMKTHFEIRNAVNQIMKWLVEGGFKIQRQEYRFSPRDLDTFVK